MDCCSRPKQQPGASAPWRTSSPSLTCACQSSSICPPIPLFQPSRSHSAAFVTAYEVKFHSKRHRALVRLLNHHSSINRLHRTIVVMVHGLGKFINLFLRGSIEIFHNVPIDTFGTWWRCERSIKSKISMIVRK